MAKKPALEVKLNNRQITLEQFGRLIADLPDKVRPGAERHVAEYLREAFQTDEPAYNYKSRARAYGLQPGGDWSYTRNGKTYTMQPVPGYFSARQFRFVMRGIAKGTITPGVSQRNGETGESWKVGGRGPVVIRNTAKHAGWLFSDRYQARQPGLVGWKKLAKLYDDNADDAFVDLVEYIDKEIIKIFKG